MISSSKFANVFGIPDRTVRTILHEANVPQTRGQGYSENFALLAIAKYFHAQLQKAEDRGTDSRKKIKDIEAQRAELDLQKELGNLVSLEEGGAIFERMGVELREKVRRMKDLTVHQKTAICDMFANLKIKRDDD